MSAEELISHCHESAIDAVRHMITSKADVNASVGGTTPLMIAIDENCRSLVSLLVDANASVSKPLPSGHLPLTYSVLKGHPDVVKLLSSRGCRVTHGDIIEAAYHGQRAVLKLLVRNFKVHLGKSILHMLPKFMNSRNDSLLVLDMIVEECVEMINDVDASDMTPLLEAVTASKPTLVTALVKAGADVSISHPDGRMPLMLASQQGDVEVVKALLPAHSQLINAVYNGRTALQFAIKADSEAVVDVLLEAGADVNDGEFPALLDAKSASMAEKLISAGVNLKVRDYTLFYVAHRSLVDPQLTRLLMEKLVVDADGEVNQRVLTFAVGEGILADVECLLSRPDMRALIDAPDSQGRTALLHAVREKHLPIIKALVDAGADVNATNNNSRFPLYWASDTETINVLLDGGADLHQTTARGTSVVHASCLLGNLEALKTFHARGVDLNATTWDGKTALMMAGLKNNLEIAKYLLLHCSPTVINARCNIGDTALLKAVNGGSYSVAHALVDAGADLNLADHGGFTPLYLCSDDELTEKLIVNGADVNTHELHETPLMAACRSGQEKKVSLLLSHGADASLADSSELNLGWSPLMLACARNHVPVTKMLLTALRASGGSANSKMSDGQTALHIAVQHSSTDCVEALLEAGVEIDVNDDGESPLHSVSDVSILRMLLKAGARDGKDSSGLTALMRACADDRLDLVNVFLEHQPPVDTTKTSTSTDTNTDIGVWSPLLLAANKSYLDIMRVLLPVEDVNFKNSSGHTALSIAARKSQPLAVKLLLDSRADPLITDKLGRTALMLAGYNLEVVKMLVDSAPEMLGFLDHRGRSTIACFCACSSSYDVLHELFTHCDRYKIDAQVNAKHDNKDTAFHWAMMGSNERAASLLLSKGAEVLNVGYMDTTVLMKPLLDEEMRSRYVGPRSLDSAVSPDDQQLADAAANACLRLVLEHIACGGASGEAEVRIPATGRGGDAGGVGEEPAAKRRRL